jgi:hypothetical protein
MAIASVGTLGTGTSSASSTSFTLTTATNSLASGDFGLLVICTDNVSTTTGANVKDHTSVTGGTGKWRKLAEYTNARGAAAGGVTVSVWLFEPTATLNTGSTITMNLASAAVDKCASFWKFTKAAGTRIMVDTEPSANAVGNSVNAANDFGSAAFSGLSSASRLYFRGLGKEANTVTALTASSGFSQITNTRSQNGTNAVAVWGEFIIDTSTGETSNPTLGVSGDAAGVFLALKEVTALTTAPANDNFDDNTVTGLNGLPFYPAAAQGGTIAEANQRTEITPPASTAGVNFRSRVTPDAYDFTSGSGLRAYIKITPGSIPLRQQCLLSVGPDPLNQYAILIDNNGTNVGFQLVRWINGSLGGVGSRTVYDATNHAWVSIRHGGSGDDKVYAEYAASSGADPPSSWSALTNETRQVDLAAAAAAFSAGTYLSQAGPVLSIFDGFNGATVGTQIGSTGVSSEADTALGLAVAMGLGVAIESSTALALSGKQIAAPGIASDAELALTLSGVAVTATGLSTETDTPLPMGAAGPLGLATETDAALALSGSQALATGIASETATSLALGVARPTALSTEAVSSFALAGVAIRTAGLVTEADSAIGLSAKILLAITAASESESALALAYTIQRSTGMAQETYSVFALTRLGLGFARAALENDHALQLSTAGAILPVGRSNETDVAIALAGVQTSSAQRASETDRALNASAAIGIRSATEADTARALAAVAIGQVSAANDNETAFVLSGSVIASVGAAAENDEAFALDRLVIHPPVVTPANRRQSGDEVSRSVSGDLASRSVAGSAADRRVSGTSQSRRVTGNLQRRRTAA